MGARVRVKRMRPEPHHRCPRYLRGVVGEVEKLACSGLSARHAASPTDLTEPVYTVRFNSVDLWGDRTDQGELTLRPVHRSVAESYLEAADE